VDSSTRQGALAAVLLGVALTGGMVLALQSLDTTPTALSSLPLPPVTFGSQPPPPSLGPRGPAGATPATAPVVPSVAPPVAPPASPPVAGPVLPTAVPTTVPPAPKPTVPTHSTAQGPQPVAVVARAGQPVAMHPFDTLAVSVLTTAGDPDGYVTRFVVNYGDGTVVERPGDPLSCSQTPSGWPAGHVVALVPEPQHVYAKPGAYKVRVTAFSAGCDGSLVQSGSASFTWNAAT
jgi:hypothetical protein